MAFQICIYFPKYPVAVRFGWKINLNSCSRHVAYIYAAFSLFSKLYKKLKNVEISLDDDIVIMIISGGWWYVVQNFKHCKE